MYRAAVILAGALAVAYAATCAPSPPSMPLHDRLAVLAQSGCTTDSVCELRAAELGIDPEYAAAPSDALMQDCMKGDTAACLYLEAGHRAECANDLGHDDCAVFRDDNNR
ncbi:hypothetical protein [Ancylobacter polymorphus]|uniref:Lipoprotein n=1 Tax=Ancylobacter polymorphus TaxID=223390 RepID=A0ABU0B6D1_9HYPH|nr:hypothetical protein [Ancylobacter polymorphus]MDQ0301380.1 hypothetical protein [Ancylobacter polymorphus]